VNNLLYCPGKQQKKTKKTREKQSITLHEMLTETFTLAIEPETENELLLSFKKQSEKWQIAHFRM